MCAHVWGCMSAYMCGGHGFASRFFLGCFLHFFLFVLKTEPLTQPGTPCFSQTVWPASHRNSVSILGVFCSTWLLKCLVRVLNSSPHVCVWQAFSLLSHFSNSRHINTPSRLLRTHPPGNQSPCYEKVRSQMLSPSIRFVFLGNLCRHQPTPQLSVIESEISGIEG